MILSLEITRLSNNLSHKTMSRKYNIIHQIEYIFINYRKAQINQQHCELLQLKITFLFEDILICFFFCDAVLYFQHHYSSLYHMILQKSFWYADLLYKKHF